MTRTAVELGPAEPVPLHAEVVGIVRFGNKTGDEFPDWITMLVVLGHQPSGTDTIFAILRLLNDKPSAGSRTAEMFSKVQMH